MLSQYAIKEVEKIIGLISFSFTFSVNFYRYLYKIVLSALTYIYLIRKSLGDLVFFEW